MKLVEFCFLALQYKTLSTSQTSETLSAIVKNPPFFSFPVNNLNTPLFYVITLSKPHTHLAQYTSLLLT